MGLSLSSSAAVVERSLKTRSVMSNGRRLHPRNIDGRSTEARRFRDLVESFADGLGGLEGLTEAERSLVRSCALLTIEAERLQAKAASGEAIDDEALTRVSNSQARLLAALRRGRSSPQQRHHDPAADLRAYLEGQEGGGR